MTLSVCAGSTRNPLVRAVGGGGGSNTAPAAPLKGKPDMNPLEFFSFRIRLAHALHDAEQQFGSAKAINARMHAEIAELRADYNEMNRRYIECEGKLTKSVIASTECARMLTQARGEIVRLKQELASAMQPRDAKGRFEKRGENA